MPRENWLAGEDSNPHSMDQNHVSYPWTTGQFPQIITAPRTVSRSPEVSFRFDREGGPGPYPEFEYH